MTRSNQNLKSLTAKLVRFGLLSIGSSLPLAFGHGAMAQEAGVLPDFAQSESGSEASSSFDAGSDSYDRTTEVTQSTESIETTQAVESTEVIEAPAVAADDCCDNRIQTVEATEATEVAAATNIYEAFRQDLSPHGRWIEIAGYGMCWQPANVDAGWRPYTVGRWTHTQYGLTWQSDEAFGECTYHYGRWMSHAGIGWCWVPGDVWAPAWVSWRQGGGCVGWAPLSPEFRVGIALRLCEPVETSYCFVRTVDVCVPHVRTCVLPFERNTTIIRNTTNITRISVVNKTVINQSINVTNFERDNHCSFERTRVQTCTNEEDVRTARSRGAVCVYQPAKLARVRSVTPAIVEHIGRTHVVAKPHVTIGENDRPAVARTTEHKKVAHQDRPAVTSKDALRTGDAHVSAHKAQKPVEPAIRKSEPAVRKVEPVIRKSEPAVRKSEPAVRKSEPAVRKSEPAVRKSEPAVRKSEPVLRKNEPVVKKTEPAVRKAEPTVRKSEPTVRKSEPAVRKNEPVVRKSEPTTRKVEPAVRKSEPVVRKAEPSVRKTEPSVKKAEPVIVRKQEAPVTRQPAKPAVVNKPVTPTVQNDRKQTKVANQKAAQPVKPAVSVKPVQPKPQISQPAKVEPRKELPRQQVQQKQPVRQPVVTPAKNVAKQASSVGKQPVPVVKPQIAKQSPQLAKPVVRQPQTQPVHSAQKSNRKNDDNRDDSNKIGGNRLKK